MLCILSRLSVFMTLWIQHITGSIHSLIYSWYTCISVTPTNKDYDKILCVSSCTFLFSTLGFLSGLSLGRIVHAVTAAVSSYVQLSCCVSRISFVYRGIYCLWSYNLSYPSSSLIPELCVEGCDMNVHLELSVL